MVSNYSIGTDLLKFMNTTSMIMESGWMIDLSQEAWPKVYILYVNINYKSIMLIYFKKGIAALGPNFISVGIHTGTLLLFEISTDDNSFICRIVGSQRSHSAPISDLGSTTLMPSCPMRDVRIFQ